MFFKFHQQKSTTKRQRNKYSLNKKITLEKATEKCDKSDFVSEKSMLEQIFWA